MVHRGLRPVATLATGFVVVAALGLLFAPVPTAWLGVWHGQLLDFGHVPLFAVLLLAFRARMGPPLRRPLAVVIVFAGLVEIVQPAVGRSGDWMDFLRGTLGALAAAFAVRTWERRHSRIRAVAHSVLAIACLVWPIVEVTPFVADTVEGRRTFPVLATFSTDHELLRWECEQATLARSAEPGCRVEFLTGPAEYPGVSLRPVVGDFGSAKWLCCEFQVTGAPLDLVISIRTGAATGGTTHTDVGHRYPASTHTARLDLTTMAARGRPESLALNDVRLVAFFMVRPQESRAIVLTRVWLEP